MEEKKPFEVVATRFKISAESAKYFLGHVQKTFKKERPTQQMIVDFMKGKKFKLQPTPHEVAKMMHESGVWAYPMHAAPATPQDEKDEYF